MGLIVNPIGFRVGDLTSWNDTWYLSDKYYSIFIHKILFIKSFLFFLLNYYLFTNRSELLYGSLYLYIYNNKYFINIFFYDTIDMTYVEKLVKTSKYGWYHKIKFKSDFLKKRVVSYKPFIQRMVLIFEYMNIFLSDVIFFNPKNVIVRKQIKFFNSMREKHGKQWLAMEEITLLRIWAKYSTGGYFKASFFYIFKFFKRLLKYKLIDLRKDKELVNNYKKFLFLFVFLDKMFKYNYGYPLNLFKKSTLMFIFRFFFYWFISKPFLTQVKKSLEWILNVLNFKSNISIFFFNNYNLNAQYIARYLIMALNYNFVFMHMIIPIRRSLDRLLNVKRKYDFELVYTSLMKKQYNIINRTKKKVQYLFFKNLYKLKKIYIYFLLKNIYLKTKRRYLLNLSKVNLSLNKYRKKFYLIDIIEEFIWNKIVEYKRKEELMKTDIRQWKKIFKNRNVFVFLKHFKNVYKYTLTQMIFKMYLKKYIKLDKKKKWIFLVYFFLFKIFKGKNFFFKNFIKLKAFCYYDMYKWELNVFTYDFMKLKFNFFFKFMKYYKIDLKNLNCNLLNLIGNNFKNINVSYFSNFILFKLNINLNKIVVREKILKKKLHLLKLSFLNSLKIVKPNVVNTKIVPLSTKLTNLNFLDRNKSVLYGYKFRFAGRFTRKQQAANLWFLKGSLSLSSAMAYVEYGFSFLTLRYSVCSVKVWLYKSKKSSKFTYKIV